MNSTNPDSLSLGGRLALVAPASYDSGQKRLHDELAEKILPWAEKAGFQAVDAAGRVIGPFNPMLRSPAISQASLDLVEAEQAHTALNKRVRETVILTVGAVWGCAYELYAHSAVGCSVGLDEPTVAALATGQSPAALTPDEQLAHEFTRQLVSNHQVDQALYGRTVEAFGEKGVVDMVFLAGSYMTTCALLNTFVVPAPVAPSEKPATIEN